MLTKTVTVPTKTNIPAKPDSQKVWCPEGFSHATEYNEETGVMRCWIGDSMGSYPFDFPLSECYLAEEEVINL